MKTFSDHGTDHVNGGKADQHHDQTSACDDPSDIVRSTTAPDGAQEQPNMLTKEKWDEVRLEMAYLKRRIAELEKLLADDVQPDDPTKPHRTLQ